MSGWTKLHDSIKEQLVGKTGVRVLIVEGEEDEAFITSLLNQKSPSEWELRWTVAIAQGKKQVLQLLEREADWVGVVDRDDWSENAAEQAHAEHPNLYVLPRFCMENYFIQPDEIWDALPPIQKKKLTGLESKVDEFKDALSAPLEQWLRHGILWHTVNPLWEGLRGLGFKEKLLNFETAQNEELIQSTLREWHDFLNPETIIMNFNEQLAQAKASKQDEQFDRWIHGKYFFRQHIVPTLNQYLRQRSADEWQSDLFKTRPIPDDLQPLWLKIGL